MDGTPRLCPQEEEQSRRTLLAPENLPSQGIINVIAGGPTNGDSNRVRKAHTRLIESLAIGESRALRETLLISFGLEDMTGVVYSHSDALVIWAVIANYDIAQVLVDSRRSVNVLFQEALNRMQLEKVQMEVVVTALFRFADHTVHLMGQITLPLTLGDEPSRRTSMTIFLVVDAPLVCKIILGYPFLSAFMVVASPYH